MVVKTLLVIPVTALNLTVMPRRFRSYQLVFYVVMTTEFIKDMHPFGLFRICKFSAVIGLNCGRSISKVCNCPFNKVYRGIAALLFVRIYKSLSCGFFNHCILIKFFSVFACIADIRDIFHIKLPLYSKLGRCIIVTVVFAFFLCGFCFLSEAKANKHPVQRTGMAGISLIFTELTVQLAN